MSIVLREGEFGSLAPCVCAREWGWGLKVIFKQHWFILYGLPLNSNFWGKRETNFVSSFSYKLFANE